MRTLADYTPTHDWIIAIKRDGSNDDVVKVHGIYRVGQQPTIPHHYYEVLAVGPGRVNPQTGFTPPLPCKPGDIIMVRHMAGDPEVVEGTEYRWYMPDEVLAVLPPRKTSFAVA